MFAILLYNVLALNAYLLLPISCSSQQLFKHRFKIEDYEFDVSLTTQMVANFRVEECCKLTFSHIPHVLKINETETFQLKY